MKYVNSTNSDFLQKSLQLAFPGSRATGTWRSLLLCGILLCVPWWCFFRMLRLHTEALVVKSEMIANFAFFYQIIYQSPKTQLISCSKMVQSRNMSHKVELQMCFDRVQHGGTGVGFQSRDCRRVACFSQHEWGHSSSVCSQNPWASPAHCCTGSSVSGKELDDELFGGVDQWGWIIHSDKLVWIDEMWSICVSKKDLEYCYFIWVEGLFWLLLFLWFDVTREDLLLHGSVR